MTPSRVTATIDAATTDREAAASADTIAWVERLIRIDTTSRNSNLGLIETVRDHFAAAGLAPLLSYDAARRKANLFATVPAAGGAAEGGVVLSGHTDVVPVDGQNWSSDPFAPEIRGDKLYGRGACDMKGFIGAAIAMLPRMQAARLARPLHFALSYDEELGCLGAPVLLADLAARGIHPAGCVVGEPTGMRVVVANKGINCYRCTVTGKAAHSSLTPKGVNAIEYAARLIVFIRDLAEAMRAQGPFDRDFDVPFTTASVGLIQGGVAHNVVPPFCEFHFEFRNLPGIDPATVIAKIEAYARDALVPAMKDVHAEAGIAIEKVAEAPSHQADENAELTRLVRALTRDDGRRKVAYATEAGIFQDAGIATVICGPGEIEQAHRADEFVTLDQLARCEDFLIRLIGSQG